MLYCISDMVQFDHGDIGLTCVQYPFGNCFRPIPYKSYLFWKNHQVMLGSLVMFQWGGAQVIHQPHTEDTRFTHFAPQSRIKYSEFIALLNENAMFAQDKVFPFTGNTHLKRCEGYPDFSVATYKIPQETICLEERPYPPRCRLSFTTSEGCSFQGIPVMDNRYFNITDQTLKQVRKDISKSQYVYIRLGLGREQDIDGEKICHFQVHGLYPDKSNYHDR